MLYESKSFQLQHEVDTSMALTKQPLKKPVEKTKLTPRVLRYLLHKWGQTKRVFYAFFPFVLTPNDAWAKEVLSPIEYDLYAQMDVRDRHHACSVAELLLTHAPESSKALLGAAFLHDIGKTQVRYNPWERIFVHLYTPKHIAAEPKEKGLKGSWQRHLYHDSYGASLIRAAGGDERMADIVAAHHHPKNDDEAALLKYIDEMF